MPNRQVIQPRKSAFKRDVLTEMVYQMGIGGLLEFKTLLSCARSGDDDGVVHSMLGSLWHQQSPGRCEELANDWLGDSVVA